MNARKFIFAYLSRRSFATTDQSEVQFFNKFSSEWWDETGPLKPLHSFNKLRIPFIREGLIQNGSIDKNYINTSTILTGLKIIDVGCGGGILSEPLAKLGAKVTGLDMTDEALKVAKHHAKINNVHNVAYLKSSIEDYAIENEEKYDAVVASEVIEHVENKEEFIQACVKCIKPGGAIFITTISKTLVAEIFAIGVAEYIGVVPKGTHEIDKFIQPHDLQRILEKCNSFQNYGVS
ncbi:hypothetical protein WA026_011731 [Henosepilachna vigintioctopunctata]|uniref:Ubiquinone biosynthesis O-methyltransferase, mitochondrial n=1 Tax=Henosepilachna vigintioctopunctata TaxID=420089 RepID=A0AAW1UK88_9CUCU